MPYSSKSPSYSSHSHKSHSQRSRSSSSSSKHPSSHASSHDSYSSDLKHNRQSAHPKHAEANVTYDVAMIPYVAQREKAAKENSKRKSKSQSKMHGVSSSAVDKDERRKQQNRDSSRASDAGKKERRAALSDYYVRESVLGEEKDLHLLSLREKNADLSDRMYRKHKH